MPLCYVSGNSYAIRHTPNTYLVNQNTQNELKMIFFWTAATAASIKSGARGSTARSGGSTALRGEGSGRSAKEREGTPVIGAGTTAPGILSRLWALSIGGKRKRDTRCGGSARGTARAPLSGMLTTVVLDGIIINFISLRLS
jgi:hypothetical protein